ncbi:MAG: response regulator transcription factor [Candidatus Contendobacter sp.]|nr:response regulator transcription factor [Candidatus Contendobacter sp.]
MLRKLRILYVEQNPLAEQKVCDWLQSLFAETLVATSTEEAIAMATAKPAQVLMTALELPDRRGLELAVALRKRDQRLPVLFTSTSTAPDDLLAAIRLQAVDYLIKPIDWPQFKAALGRLADHVVDEGNIVVRLGCGWLYWTHEAMLEREGQVQTLTPRERRLIDVLATRPGRWVNTERLLCAVYENPDHASEAGLKNLVMRLRRKIGQEVIVSGYGTGYRLLPPGDD